MTAKDRVLVVDDHRDTLEIMTMLLELLGHEAHVASRGRDAIAAAKQIDPDLVLVDLHLPDISGFAVAEAIRAEKPNAFLVALSGYGRAQDLANAKRAGFDEHHLKPIDLARVKGFLRSSAAHRGRRRNMMLVGEAMMAG
jgi:CheY-like chemotaxis protein